MAFEMIPVMCMVQEGQITPSAKIVMKAEIHNFIVREFSVLPRIDWVEIPKGSGFSGGRPSTSLITSIHSNIKLRDEEREAMLVELSAILSEQIGRSPDETLVTIRDPQ